MESRAVPTDEFERSPFYNNLLIWALPWNGRSIYASPSDNPQIISNPSSYSFHKCLSYWLPGVKLSLPALTKKVTVEHNSLIDLGMFWQSVPRNCIFHYKNIYLEKFSPVVLGTIPNLTPYSLSAKYNGLTCFLQYKQRVVFITTATVIIPILLCHYCYYY